MIQLLFWSRRRPPRVPDDTPRARERSAVTKNGVTKNGGRSRPGRGGGGDVSKGSGREVSPPGTMAARYEHMRCTLLREHGVRVRKWRTSMSGVAWEVRYADGRVSKLIEAPLPKGPMSAAVFCHEIGHHAIGLSTYRLRCVEEYHAWAWSLDAMQRFGLNVTDRVRSRMHDSLYYALIKAQRRGMKSIPAELVHFASPRPGGWGDRTGQRSGLRTLVGGPPGEAGGK